MSLVSVLRRYQLLDLLVVLVNFFGNVSLSFQHRSLEFFSFSFFFLHITYRALLVVRKGELSAIFDSQIENFSSQVLQRLNSTETDFC